MALADHPARLRALRQLLLAEALGRELLDQACRALDPGVVGTVAEATNEEVGVADALALAEHFADGGRFTTKPYIASGAYIDRMSNYCGGCAFARAWGWWS